MTTTEKDARMCGAARPFRKKLLPTVADVRERVVLDAASGELYWAAPLERARYRSNKALGSAKRLAGKPAGRLRLHGYLEICVLETPLMAHWVVWALTHGFWPRSEIDHINRIKTDNRPINLREATRAQNIANTVARSTSGFKGVSWDSKFPSKPWRAQIRMHGKTVCIGHFSCAEEASEAYRARSASLHGPFAEHVANEVASRASLKYSEATSAHTRRSIAATAA